MFEYLIVNQQMPRQVPPAQQYPQQPVQQQQMQRPQPIGRPVAQQPGVQQPYPQQEESVSMKTILQWGGIAGAAAGAIQGIFGFVSGFDILGFMMTIIVSSVLGILVGILLGQFGNKIPIKGSIMMKSALFMFVISLIAGFIFGLGEGPIGLIAGIIGVGAGAFLYGWLIQNKVPNLV